MKRMITTICIVFIIGFVITRPFVINGLISFFFAGIIPGTQYALPFWAMQSLLIIMTLVILVWLSRQTFYIGDTSFQKNRAKQQARQEIARTIARRQTKQPAAAAPASASARTRRRYQPVTSS